MQLALGRVLALGPWPQRARCGAWRSHGSRPGSVGLSHEISEDGPLASTLQLWQVKALAFLVALHVVKEVLDGVLTLRRRSSLKSSGAWSHDPRVRLEVAGRLEQISRLLLPSIRNFDEDRKAEILSRLQAKLHLTPPGQPAAARDESFTWDFPEVRGPNVDPKVAQ